MEHASGAKVVIVGAAKGILCKVTCTPVSFHPEGQINANKWKPVSGMPIPILAPISCVVFVPSQFIHPVRLVCNNSAALLVLDGRSRSASIKSIYHFPPLALCHERWCRDDFV